MNTIACVTANYVARQLNYNMTEGWGQGAAATSAYFRPLDTFAERFDALLHEIAALDFRAIDLWVDHLHPQWATSDHIVQAKAALARYNLQVTSLAGSFGATPAEFERSCQLAVALDAPLLGGNTSLLYDDRAAVVALLDRFDRKLGIENHPEKTPAEVLAKIGDGANGRIGATLDTGWFGTKGYDAAQAIHELRDHLFSVHLKDVLAPGAHDTCRYGDGIVPIEQCVVVLHAIGYRGVISVEHEPEHHNPTDDVRTSYAMLRSWRERTMQ